MQPLEGLSAHNNAPLLGYVCKQAVAEHWQRGETTCESPYLLTPLSSSSRKKQAAP